MVISINIIQSAPDSAARGIPAICAHQTGLYTKGLRGRMKKFIFLNSFFIVFAGGK